MGLVHLPCKLFNTVRLHVHAVFNTICIYLTVIYTQHSLLSYMSSYTMRGNGIYNCFIIQTNTVFLVLSSPDFLLIHFSKTFSLFFSPLIGYEMIAYCSRGTNQIVQQLLYHVCLYNIYIYFYIHIGYNRITN